MVRTYGCPGGNARCLRSRQSSSAGRIQASCLIDALIGFRDDALTDYLNGLPPALRFGFDGALAVAGPLSRDKVALTDLGWSFSTRDLHRSLELGSLKVVNVFVATPDTDVFPVRPRTREAAGPIGIIDPGTGLGVRALIPTDENG
jgi:glucokinase